MAPRPYMLVLVFMGFDPWDFLCLWLNLNSGLFSLFLSNTNISSQAQHSEPNPSHWLILSCLWSLVIWFLRSYFSTIILIIFQELILNLWQEEFKNTELIGYLLGTAWLFPASTTSTPTPTRCLKIQSSSDTIYIKLMQVPQVKGPQDFRRQLQVGSLGNPHFYLANYKFGSFHSSLIRFNNSLKQFTGLRITLTITGLLQRIQPRDK